MTFQFGLEVLLEDSKRLSELKKRRVALVAHPASVNQSLEHAIDGLVEAGVRLTCAFGPQHGLKGDKQDNMIETDDEIDARYKIPIFSLYGKVRRPTDQMLEHCDLILFDLQDVGCRIYTFLTTLFYILEDAARTKKTVWILDRPNPAGRVVEGSLLRQGFESFVGAAPVPMRHGLTLGEAALWYRDFKKLNVDLEVVQMQGYTATEAPGFGWPIQQLSWVNPSPNIPRLSSCRSFCGTVLIEGTTLSEGRGTTIPLEIVGAPGINNYRLLEELQSHFPEWCRGAILRPLFFEPTFHKYAGQLASGIQIHTDGPFYQPQLFQPYRLIAGFLKTVRRLYPNMGIWRQPPYEYETVRLPIDLLTGSDFLRKWVDDSKATASDFEAYQNPDETNWLAQRRPYLLYGE